MSAQKPPRGTPLEEQQRQLLEEMNKLRDLENSWELRLPGSEPWRFMIGICIGRMQADGATLDAIDAYLAELMGIIRKQDELHGPGGIFGAPPPFPR